jgi:hypothetical protein
MGFSRQEIEEAFDEFRAAADEAGRTGDWRAWAACFTDDVHYIEHLYGEFHGREAVHAWIDRTMNAWPFTHMQVFPWDWVTIDAEQGWVIGQVQNRFVDPGDGQVYEAPNWTRLVYAGSGLFASEEDVYNPADFAPVVEAWLAAWATHHPDERDGAPRP